MYNTYKIIKRNLTVKVSKVKPPILIALIFTTIILLGSLLLTLPISSQNRESTTFLDCLFTATSATCVTGLVVVDTSLHWSYVGQVVILSLIQIGGLGFMTLSSLFLFIFKGRISLQERVLIKESLNQNNMANYRQFIRYIVRYTLFIEGCGALVLGLRFIPDFGWARGIYYAVFHSVSAFCNAGFDLLGKHSSPFSSLNMYAASPLVVFTLSILVILGGIGFSIIIFLFQYKSWKEWSDGAKIATKVTISLLILGTLLLFITEYQYSLASFDLNEKFLLSFFQSMTTRTAGFSSMDLTQLREGTVLLMIVLMFIGASPASTGGGLKTTTFYILLASCKAFLRQEKDIHVQKRRIDEYSVRKAMTLFIISIALAFVGTYLISLTQRDFSLLESAFEVISALATVGLSLEGSSHLNLIGKLIIIIFMFIGRVGSLTFFSMLTSEKNANKIRYPKAEIMFG